MLNPEGEAGLEEQYVQGYQRDPETWAELGWIESECRSVLEAYPWDAEPQL